MAGQTLEGKTVQELQSLAAEAVAAPLHAPRGLSRAARLHLIDQLSRWGGSGLALFAGAAVFLTVVVARNNPVRAAVWATMLFAALYLCRRYRKEFRRGDRIASRPFRWRAYYVSTVAVVSAAFGAGAFLLIGESATEPGGVDTLILMMAASASAAIMHCFHRPAALAAGLPAIVAIVGAAFARTGATPFSYFLLGIAATSVAALVILSAVTADRAAARFPRTTFVRREAIKPVAAGLRAVSSAADRAAAN